MTVGSSTSGLRLVVGVISVSVLVYVNGLGFSLLTLVVLVPAAIFLVTSKPAVFKKYFWINTGAAVVLFALAAVSLCWALFLVR